MTSSAPAPGPPNVLVVQHEPGAPAGWLGEALVEHGCVLTVAAPYAGSSLPDLGGTSGLLVLGGSVDSWDDAAAPWLPATRDLVRAAEAARVPTLGVCLGHQIAAHALGGRAGRNPAGRTLGIEPVGWLDAAHGDSLFGPAAGAGRAVHWNRDVVTDLPDGAEVLARSADGAVQVARLGRSVWGIQSHPEVDASIVQCWLDEDWDNAGEAQREQMTALVDRLGAEQEQLIESWRPLAAAFASLVRRDPGATT